VCVCVCVGIYDYILNVSITIECAACIYSVRHCDKRSVSNIHTHRQARRATGR